MPVPAEIKILLLRKGITQAEIARRLGIERAVITTVLTGRGTSARVVKAVAEAVGMKPSEFKSKYIPRKAA